MSIRNTSTAYGSVSKWLHWSLFILLTLMVTYGFLLSSVPEDYQGVAFNTHKLIGLCLLTLLVIRVLWAAFNPKPSLPKNTQLWQYWATYSVHTLLYAIAIAIPLAGWIGSSSAGRAPHLGSVTFALPIEKNKTLISASFDAHEILVFVLIGLVVMHTLAAFYHHYIKKDDVLRRML